MSRRHAPTAIRQPLTRVVSAGLVMLLALASILPAGAAAQDENITDKAVQWEWQLLTQRDADGQLEPVPAGVGATLLLFVDAASGEGACSTYDSTYTKSSNIMSIFIQPDEITWRECDPTSRAFDEVFYRNLAEVTSISRADSVLTLKDSIGDELMTLTRASIDDDPTVARWDLTRIGAADGSVEPVIQGLDPWVEFLRGGRVVGSTGCGSFLGSYSTNEGTIDITEVAYRLETCTEGARMQAERIIATIDEIDEFTVRPAGLALQDDRGTTRLALTPRLDLGRRTWTPIEILSGQGETLREEGPLSSSAVRFASQSMEGRSICRPFKGVALRSGLALAVTKESIVFIGKPCKSKAGGVPVEQIEEDLVDALEATSSHALRGSELELKDVNGVTRMRLLPQPALVGPTWVVKWMRQGKKRPTPVGDTPITATFEDVGVVQGDTGATGVTGANEYFGPFRTPAAARVLIGPLEPTGKACRGKRANSAACKQEKRFIALLQSADAYYVRDDDLKILRGTQDIIGFERETFDNTEN